LQYPPDQPNETSLAVRRESANLALDRGLPTSDPPPLRDYWRAIKKRRWLIGSVFSAIVLAVLSVVLTARDVYTADATLLIEPEAAQILEIPQVLSQSLGADSYYETQYEILGSRALAAEVVRTRAAALEESSPPSWLRGLREELAARLRGAASPTPEEQLDARITAYQDSLSIEPLRDTRLVRIAFHASDPVLAARMANAHAETYIGQGLGMRTRASHEARSFLLEQARELHKRVAEAQAKLAAYSTEHGIVALDDRSNVVVTRLAELNAQLTDAETERMARETDWRLLRTRGADSTPAVLASPLITGLKQDLAVLEDQYASLASRYRPGFPDLDELKLQLEEARGRLEREIGNIAAGVESAYIAARAHESALRQRVESQKSEALQLKDASVGYALLESELSTSRKLHGYVQERIQQTDVSAELRDSNVFLLHPAEPPVRPSGPSKALLLAAGLVLALLGSIGSALIAEKFDGRVRTSEEFERHLGLPTLGTVPDLSRRGAATSILPMRRLEASARGREAESAGDPAAHPPLLPHGAPAQAIEAYRRIRTNILLSQAEQAPRTLLFTSAGPGEGKTTTALNTAQLFAQLGGPVLVIDADLRKPECHLLLGVKNSLGLTEILTGGTLAPESVHRVARNLSLLLSGKRPPNPTELVASDLMKQLLARACDNFDYILIDAPPLLAVSDSVILATMVDGVVLVADQQRTQRTQLKAAHARLAHARAKVLGTVLNRADVEEEGYGPDWWESTS